MCGAGLFDNDEWQVMLAVSPEENGGGFVETESDNFPLVLVARRGEKSVLIHNVRADSISVQVSSIPGYVDILFEFYGSSVMGTVPMVDYYITEAE